ncbi:helix-turn-helix domain-containing protein [Streptomyces sp. SID3343]|uniref:helix-turn-helix domain-containing protein n=1 Tax=Streptomyces sp. SID3343 TaxID=2690260 RepID=UPI00136A5CC7|nr:helix-turn-helix domain-containing protein [Streptomyces sp. SID3343]
MSDDDVLMVEEVMAWLKLGRTKVYDLMRTQQLESFTVGRSRRIPAVSVRAFIAGRLEEEVA